MGRRIKLSQRVKFDADVFNLFMEMLGKEKAFAYSPELVLAVLYLMEKGITRSGEIAKRLDISPQTVCRIKAFIAKFRKRVYRLQEGQEPRGRANQVGQAVGEGREEVRRVKKKKKHKDILELLGLEGEAR